MAYNSDDLNLSRVLGSPLSHDADGGTIGESFNNLINLTTTASGIELVEHATYRVDPAVNVLLNFDGEVDTENGYRLLADEPAFFTVEPERNTLSIRAVSSSGEVRIHRMASRRGK